MSLTSFLRESDVRERFNETFSKPPLPPKKRILAPALCKQYTLTGTAFDYLMRLELERLNRRRCILRPWVAYSALACVDHSKAGNWWDDLNWLYQIIGEVIFEAEKQRLLFLRSGRLTTAVIRACLNLASVDPIYRGGIPLDPPNEGFVSEKLRILQRSRAPSAKLNRTEQLMVMDLRSLAHALRRNSRLWRAKRVCVLNPTFRRGSDLVGGADADLVLDDLLVEIKTTKERVLKRSHLNQLIGHYILSRIGDVKGIGLKRAIGRLGVYFSRYGELVTFRVRDVTPRRGMPTFIKWFEERARRSFG